ncbi:FAD-dependent oxidoreductase [Agromyces sp. Marseille-Q5079]|uniref:FAD-dependent oxidoreductase n=1 Tax=Agromyces sp. Marseille-Q5079 TaxID=3439059 RepID=UPI003D9CBDCF
MRVGVIGGGAAGLTTAWLLDEHHEVTLYERETRLGGHAHTIEFEALGRRHAIDAGFAFFSPGANYASFNRLLDALGVQRETYAATLTVYDADAQHPIAMPPIRGRMPVWPSLAPASLGTLVRFRAFLDRLPAFLARHDTSITVAEYLERARLPKAFVDEFLLPLLLAFWCVERTAFLGFAAYNALYYLGANAAGGFRAPAQSEIVGGMRVYVDAITASLERAAVLLAAEVVRVRRDDGIWQVTDAAGEVRTFDRLVLACNPRRAHALVEPVPELAAVARELARFETFETTIAIHGDRRLMPDHEASWSVVNARHDGEHSSLSVWNPRLGLPVFKSWVTYDARLPEPLYALAVYEHGSITPAYFDAQARLKPMNGGHGLWLAGLAMHDVDSHESAVRSAMTVARALAPDSSRLRTLAGAH